MGTSPTSPLQSISEGRSEERGKRRQSAVADLEHDGSTLHDNSDAESPTHHPTAKPSRKECPNRNSTSSSGSSSTGSCSRSVSDAEDENDEERGEKDGGGLDDWEAMADALSVSPDNGQDHQLKADDSQITASRTKPVDPLKQEPDRTIPRAWRPDDAFRPQSLPNLSKQRSFPANNHRGILSRPPSSCPICYEDLDLTDSSFLPCSCGFHLCLFCHKRILEADGRCPGCRKQYSTVAGDEEIGVVTGIGVPPLSYRLSRSCSMSSGY
ncbi:uncharacterized protein A4U43_C01F1780 [Asparagus officinalis]|uniref:RING-type domain-containing protein n=2 Tax=Asparagus officinalis TaxID=4686 RepID=A0A5P1FLM5_ASPOF|nr:uncharacterized protein A4U43_C01F1780 [Asparagus officinalis]